MEKRVFSNFEFVNHVRKDFSRGLNNFPPENLPKNEELHLHLNETAPNGPDTGMNFLTAQTRFCTLPSPTIRHRKGGKHEGAILRQ
jgi:hypothetical protein